MRLRLAERGADEGLATYVEDLLLTEHQRLHEVLLAEEGKRRALLGMICTLEVRGGSNAV